jgi:DNA replication protein DnaC
MAREWAPPVVLAGKTLVGTGVWRSALHDGRCEGCQQTLHERQAREQHRQRLRHRFINQAGGVRAYREYTFERYRVTDGNRTAVALALQFDPARNNVYIWGPCGVGKTHLAVALVRRWFSRGASFVLLTPFQLIRRLRMRSPEEEQAAIDALIQTPLLGLDDLGAVPETAYGRQVLQEILDARHLRERGGLIVTSPHPPRRLADRSSEPALVSRLVRMCDVVEIRGTDQRQGRSLRRPE